MCPVQIVRQFSYTGAHMTKANYSAQDVPAALAVPRDAPAGTSLMGSLVAPKEDCFLRYIKSKDIPDILKSIAAMEVQFSDGPCGEEVPSTVL
jgi:hypothetical protein